MAQFYSLEEAARMLGMSADELKQKAQSREVRAFLDSGSWRFRVADIDELARRRGMGSDPDLSLSDLDLEVSQPMGSGSEEINLAEFQLGVASPGAPKPDIKSSDEDVLLDDMSLPPGPVTGSSSTIIGMKPAGKQPSDSDVRLVPEGAKGASDSDVRLTPAEARKPPSDSDVTLVADDSVSHGSSDEALPIDDPNATMMRPSPLVGSSAEVQAQGSSSDSDFELTPSSVIDALQPDSGSDFELTALDASDEFETTPEPPRGPGDSDVTGAEPATSGINLSRPSDSGINLQSAGGLDLNQADSIELAPVEEDPKAKRPAAKPAGKAAAKQAQKADPSATALPIRSADPSATALPIKAKGEKDIFEDTDFEVDALDSGHEDQTVQLEAASDFDIEESDSASEVFAIDEEDVDENAATAMRPAGLAADDDEEFGDEGGEGVSGETDTAWTDVEGEEAATPSQAPSARAASPMLSSAGAGPEWGGLWVGLLGFATFLVLLLAFVGLDLVSNLYENRGSTNPIGYGLIKQISSMMGG